MYMSYLVRKRPRSTQVMLVLGLLLSLLLTTACGGDAQIRQRASGSEVHFHQLLQHAYRLGLTEAILFPVLQSAQQLDNAGAPFSPFSDQPLNTYYVNRALRYQQLQTQLRQLITASTVHERQLAMSDIRQTQSSLRQMTAQGLPVHSFLVLLSPLQRSVLQARTFGGFATVVTRNAQVQQLLSTVASTSGCLDEIKSITAVLHESHLDVTTLRAASASDQILFIHINGVNDLLRTHSIIEGHYQQALVNVMQAMPAITADRFSTLGQLVRQLPGYDVDAASYQHLLDADQQFARTRMSWSHFREFVAQIDADIQKTRFALLTGETRQAIQQFHLDVSSWSRDHMYHDDYDGQDYAIDTSYLPDNFGNDADNLLAGAHTADELQQALSRVEDLRFTHQLLEQNYSDATPYNQVHQTDLIALAHYHVQSGQVIVVSLAEQALRLYQDGKLVRSFQVTTGRNELPSPPGIWSVQDSRSPTLFHSTEPLDSPYWYPDTHINFAILFHAGGYFIHDSWWRDNYGPGTQFPHSDASGDQRSSGNGSHGCVNLSLDDASWIYNNTGWNTAIIVY